VATLDDALDLCVLIAEQQPDRFERAAVRWHGRLEVEGAPLELRDPCRVERDLVHDPPQAAVGAASVRGLARPDQDDRHRPRQHCDRRRQPALAARFAAERALEPFEPPQ
jgi:hypothetical protein